MGRKEFVFNGYRVSALQEEKCVGTDGRDGCAPVQRELMSPNCALKNGGEEISLYVYLTTIKNIFQISWKFS